MLVLPSEQDILIFILAGGFHRETKTWRRHVSLFTCIVTLLIFHFCPIVVPQASKQQKAGQYHTDGADVERAPATPQHGSASHMMCHDLKGEPLNLWA